MDALNPMRNPPRPDEFITETQLVPFGATGRTLARRLNVAPSTQSRVLNGSDSVSPEMALHLSKALGRSAESWLAMRDAHDLWVARPSLRLEHIEPLNLGAA